MMSVVHTGKMKRGCGFKSHHPAKKSSEKDLLCSVRRHFFVVAISPSFDTVETSLCLFGEAKGPGNALLQSDESACEDAFIDGHARGIAPEAAFIAKPFVWKMVGLHHVHALEVERAWAAITADDIAGVTTCRAVFIIVGALGCPHLSAQFPPIVVLHVASSPESRQRAWTKTAATKICVVGDPCLPSLLWPPGQDNHTAAFDPKQGKE